MWTCTPKDCSKKSTVSPGTAQITGRWDAALFGEAQSRIVVSLATESLPKFVELASEHGVPWMELGHVGGNDFAVAPHLSISVADLATAWRGGLGVTSSARWRKVRRPS